MVQKIHLNTLSNTMIRALCIKLSQMTGYVRTFESNTIMSFKISNKQLLKKYNQIWKRVEKKFIKIKIIKYYKIYKNYKIINI